MKTTIDCEGDDEIEIDDDQRGGKWVLLIVSSKNEDDEDDIRCVSVNPKELIKALTAFV